MIRAIRIRKARRETMCILCRRQIITGQQIGLLPSGWWAHAECITTANHQEPS